MSVCYLPVLVTDLPASFVYQSDGALREKVSRAVAIKVVRVIAGAEKCHVVVDIKRPYYSPRQAD
jgi:hypothetical protein